MFSTLLDFLFPRRSLTGVPGTFVNPEERRELATFPMRIEKPVLRQCGVRALDRVVAAGTYAHSPLLQKAIHTFKYRRIPALHRELGMLLAHAAPLLAAGTDAVLCPVPLHWTRRFSRGFNQALLLATMVSRECGWPVQELLSRKQCTRPQARRHLRRERRSAMRHAFQCVAHSPLHVILVDDVMTSGATLDSCAKELRRMGAKNVEALVVAKG